jgi:two-component system cell cycle sensor histidine kinase/response regulator CckA
MTEKLNPIHVLLVEDDAGDAILVERTLRRDGLQAQCERVDTADAMKAALERRPWDVVLSDFTMPRFSGMAAFELLRATARDTPFIFVSGTVGEENAVRAMKLGAADYLLKGQLARLVPAIQRELRDRDDRERRIATERELRKALESKEEQLRQSQKMEAVGRLAGGVAHDFNNMLSVILGYSELAAAGLAPSDERFAHLQEVRKAGKRAADLTKQLLLFSRHQDPEQRVLDLNKLLGGADKLFRRLLGEDVELEYQPTSAPTPIRANPGHVEQVLMNLVVNARDAMPTGGKLTLATSSIVLSSAAELGVPSLGPGAYIRVSVSDTGTGMDRATQERIFEPFFTTKDAGKGTGLGLSMVFGIVQQSSGAIEVQTKLGQGTTFHLYFPRASTAPEETGMRTMPPARRGSETILLIEDEDGVRKIAQTILKRNGYTVLEARNAEQAVALCEEHLDIGLVVSDIVMPKQSGPEVLRRIRASLPGVRVLFMSGYTDESLARYPLEAGEAFLQKPFTPMSLAQKVREVLDAG